MNNGDTTIPGVAGDSAAYSPFNIQDNHSDMVKFRSAEDDAFKTLPGELIRRTQSTEKSEAHELEYSSTGSPQYDATNIYFGKTSRSH